MVAIVYILVIVLTFKIGKISPVKAISGGMEQIYFDSRLKTQINKRILSLTLAFRQFIINKKHYIGTIIISAALVFFMMSISLLANCVSSERFMESIGKIPCDLEAQLYFKQADIMTELNQIKKEIEKTAKITNFTATSIEYISLNGVNIHCDFYSDPSIIEKTLIKGRVPKYDNEFAITQIVAEEYGLNIGDEVTLSCEEKEKKYLITGLYQSSTELGMCISMSYNAYKRIGNDLPDYLYIKLADSSLAKQITDSLNETFPGQVEAVLSDSDNQQMTLVETAFNGISALIYIISIIFALITVSMVCMRSFLRERTDIGIYKSIGFTVQQLHCNFLSVFLPFLLSVPFWV